MKINLTVMLCAISILASTACAQQGESKKLAFEPEPQACGHKNAIYHAMHSGGLKVKGPEKVEFKVQKDKANNAHFIVGKKVRKTIKELGGTMPEDLPPTESIKKVEGKKSKLLLK